MGDMQTEIIELIEARLLENAIEKHLEAEKEASQQQTNSIRESEVRSENEQIIPDREQYSANCHPMAQTH